MEKGVQGQMNEFLIGAQGENIVFLRPVPQRLTRAQAVSLAAWLIAIADPSGAATSAKTAEITGGSPIIGAILE